jgi:hypothetical protein
MEGWKIGRLSVFPPSNLPFFQPSILPTYQTEGEMIMTLDIDIILSKMQATRDELLSFVEGLDAASLTWHPPEGGWSMRDNLAHLVDAEHAHRRFVQAVLEGRSVHLEGFDQPVGEILDALRAEREETLILIVDIPPHAWDRRGDHPALGEVSVQQVIRTIGVHERMHLKEVRKLLEAQKDE